MTFFQKLSPGYTPAHLAGKSEILILREKVLQAMLLLFGVLGTLVVALAGLAEFQAGNIPLVLTYTGVWVLLIAALLLRGLPYGLRARVITTLAFALAVVEMFESGQMGDVRMFLVTFIALTAILFGYRTVISAIVLGLALLVGTGYYVAVTPVPFAPALAHLREGTDWITSSSTYLMVSTIISGAVSYLTSGLAANLSRQSELARHLEQERSSLESRVEERTRDMSHHIRQLNTALEISRVISTLSDPEGMLQQVIDVIKERFGLYYVGVFLIDSTRQNAVLQAGTGEAGKRMLAVRHQLAVSGSSMIGWAIANRSPRIALDVGAEAVRFNNPHLPLTRSEMALPIAARDSVIGALTVQSEKANAFDENDIAILKNVADSLATALENDRLFKQTRKSLEEIRALNHAYLQRAWAETLDVTGHLGYAYENENYSGNGRAIERDWSARTIEVPLMLRDEVIGTLTLEMDRDNLSADEQSFIENVNTQTAIALENARLLHETERRAVQEQKLNELATRFSRAQTIDEILRAAVQELGQLPAVAQVSVQLNPDMTQAVSSLSRGSGGGKEPKE